MTTNQEGNTKTMVKVVPAIKIPNLSDEGIEDWYSYQPKSDYRKLVKIERLSHSFAIKLTLEEQLLPVEGSNP